MHWAERLQAALFGYVGLIFVALLVFGFFVVRGIARRAEHAGGQRRVGERGRSGDGYTGDSGSSASTFDGSAGRHSHDGDRDRPGGDADGGSSDAGGSDGGGGDGGGGGGD